uniref:Uncharacterized protein n=1 Tax=Corethrella appendiculata TaxID=1370023 RepID=U5EN41_9DIPT
MLISRGLLLSKTIKTILNNKKIVNNNLIRSSSAWSYRAGPPPHSKAVVYGSHLVGGFMWWWVLWHLWHDYEHITGEFEYPDPAEWTNAELGIPPDSYEE